MARDTMARAIRRLRYQILAWIATAAHTTKEYCTPGNGCVVANAATRGAPNQNRLCPRDCNSVNHRVAGTAMGNARYSIRSWAVRAAGSRAVAGEVGSTDRSRATGDSAQGMAQRSAQPTPRICLGDCALSYGLAYRCAGC